MIASLVVFCCIAFAASTPIAETQGDDTSCLPPVADSDQLLYQSFESMHKWVDNKLAAKYEVVKQEAAQTLTKLQETIHEKTTQQINELQQAISGEKEDILKRFSQLQETISSNLAAMKNEISELRGQLSEFSNGVAQVNELKEQIGNGLKEQNQQIQQQATSIQDVNNRVAQCVTDIKVSGREHVAIHQATGFSDEGNRGYVITGVHNWNHDMYVDSVDRRQVLFQKNNAWTLLHE